MDAGDTEDEAVSLGEWCELLDEHLASLMDLLENEGRTFYYESQRGSRSKTKKRFDTRRKVQGKNGRRDEDRRNEDGYEEKGF